jgi:hypothetical protein
VYKTHISSTTKNPDYLQGIEDLKSNELCFNFCTIITIFLKKLFPRWFGFAVLSFTVKSTIQQLVKNINLQKFRRANYLYGTKETNKY